MHKKKILIVDDEEEICLLLSGILKKYGYETNCAYNLEDGLKKIKSDIFQAIFLDLNLPDGVGFEIIPKIRAEENNAKVIIISAYDGVGERQRASRDGFDFFIGKPGNRKKIEEALETVEI